MPLLSMVLPRCRNQMSALTVHGGLWYGRRVKGEELSNHATPVLMGKQATSTPWLIYRSQLWDFQQLLILNWLLNLKYGVLLCIFTGGHYMGKTRRTKRLPLAFTGQIWLRKFGSMLPHVMLMVAGLQRQQLPSTLSKWRQKCAGWYYICPCFNLCNMHVPFTLSLSYMHESVDFDGTIPYYRLELIWLDHYWRHQVAINTLLPLWTARGGGTIPDKTAKGVALFLYKMMCR